MVQGLVRYPGLGCIVEFMQGNAPQLAWVLEEQHGKLRLLLPNRREMLLTVNRILPWAGPTYSGINGKDEAIAKLEEHKAKRAACELSIDPFEIWELAQGEVSKTSTDWLIELAASNPTIDDMAACGHLLLNCKTHFRFQPPDFEVFSEEVVNIRLAEQEAKRRRDALINGGGEFFRQLWEIHQRKNDHQAQKKPDESSLDPEVAERLQHMIMARIANPETQEDDLLWKNLIRGLPDDPFVPLYLAQSWNLVGSYYNFWMDRIGYAVGDTWSKQYNDEINTIITKVQDQENEPPSCNLPFISIDAPVTRDIDDAFFIETLGDGWKIVIALACPAENWIFEGPLDLAVRQRSSSLYLPEATYHMLPESLGINACSLLQKKTRPAFFVTCEVASDGTLLSTTPSFGTVRLAANLTYEQCESVINNQSKSENPAFPFFETLRQAAKLSEAHLSKRLKNGAVVIKRPELLITLKGEGDDIQVDLDINETTPTAHDLVSEMMILANAGLANWAEEKGIALLHRTQDIDIPPEYWGIWTEPTDIAKVARVLAPAVLEVPPHPHAGLGEKAYAPSSSPLRRYADFVNEAQILHMIRTGSPRWSSTDMTNLKTFVGIRMDAVGQVQKSRPRFWKLLYFQQHGDRWWSAVVTDENDMVVTLTLPREQLIVRSRRALFSERTYIGQEVEIRLTKIRPLYNDFQVAEVRE